MRISFQEFYSGNLQRILSIQDTLNVRQNQAASGKKIEKISDNPQASGRIINLEQQITQLEAYQVNIDAVNRHLSAEELAIKGYTSALNRIRELTVALGNTALHTSEDRQSLLQEISLLQGEIVDLANTTNASGEYIFSGYQALTKPFTQDSAGRYVFNGDQGQRFLQVSSDSQVAINDSGQDIFMDINAVSEAFATANGVSNTGGGVISTGRITDLTTWQANASNAYVVRFNPLNPGSNYDIEDAANPGVPLAGFDDVAYVPGADISVSGVTFSISGTPQPGDTFTLSPVNNQSVFTVIDNLVAGMASGDSTIRDYTVGKALDGLDSALNVAIGKRSEIGARMNVGELAESFNADIINFGTESIGKERDIDYAEVISDISQLTLSLEVAQQSFIKTQGLTIFQLL